MLIGAVDMSGGKGLEYNKYMAIVIGHEKYLKHLADSFGSKPVHMVEKHKKLEKK